jgi:DNA (cytosine-5)-methyltransferase 1
VRGFHQVHLFAGIGGMPLGLRWAGVADDFAIWTGGFPCQDISGAGKRTGILGERSGLWGEFHRLIRLVRPRYVLLENVADIVYRGIDRVLGDLAESGYDVEWDCLPAASVGAPHIRDRAWLVAYPNGHGCTPSAGVPPRSQRRGMVGQPLLRYPPPLPAPHWRTDQPGVCRVADGLSVGLDRLRGHALGNAVAPQVVQYIAERILTAERNSA